MSTSPFGTSLSARLNDVPLPDGLLGRLRLIPLTSDADLDRALAEVALPPGLTGRLSAIASRQVSPRRVSFTVPATMKRVAAAVATLAVGLGYVFSVTTLVYSRFDQPVLADEPLRLSWAQSPGAAVGDDTWLVLEPAAIEPAPDSDAEGGNPISDRLAPDLRNVGGNVELSGEIGLVGEPIALAELGDGVDGPNAMNLLPASMEAVAEPFGEWTVERSRVHVVAGADANLAAEAQQRVLPWLDTASRGTVAVELPADDASYRYCRREIESGRLPLEACVRVEEFLAAFEYDLVDRGPAERGAGVLAITVAAAPSPFGPLSETVAPAGRSRWLVAVGVEGPLGTEPPLVTVGFAPERVRAYRIVGYGLAPVSGKSGPQAATQPAAEASEGAYALERASAVLLFEIELTDTEVSPAALGEVRVVWRDARGRTYADQAALNRSSFAESFETAPRGWRQAALVALAAEGLAGSPFAEHVSLADVAVLARKIEPRVDDRSAWREFAEMTGKAQSLRAISQRNHYRL